MYLEARNKVYREYVNALREAVKTESIEELTDVIKKYKILFDDFRVEEFINTSEEIKRFTLYKIMLSMNISDEYNKKAISFLKKYKGESA